MATIVMRYWSSWPRCPKGRSQWRIGSDDHSNVVMPSNRRLRALFRKHSPIGGELKVVYRGTNCCTVQMPAGIPPKGREPFVRAVQEVMNGA